MQCDKCGTAIDPGDDREFGGQVVCEDCYMDSLSPARTCDPWAVHSAKTLKEQGGREPEINELQTQILEILAQTGGLEPAVLAARLNVKPVELERQIASLRHMEKVRGALQEGRKVIRLW